MQEFEVRSALIYVIPVMLPCTAAWEIRSWISHPSFIFLPI